MLPKDWKPKAVSDLIRVGGRNDGGYSVPRKAVQASKLLLSMGLNADWRFEDEFRRLSGARVICFDHTVDGRFWALYTLKQLVRFRLVDALKFIAYRRFFDNEAKQHRRQKIGYDSGGGVSLSTLLRDLPDDAIFLKVDIEGSEYRILDQIVSEQARFTGITMELHDVDLNRGALKQFIGGLTRFEVVYLHANNYGGVDDNGDPLTLEITLVRRDLAECTEQASSRAMKGEPNDPSQPDIELAYAD